MREEGVFLLVCSVVEFGEAGAAYETDKRQVAKKVKVTMMTIQTNYLRSR